MRRANVSNIDIETSRDYFGQNKKVLISMFKKYNNFDLISYFAENWINIIEEDRWRLILESWDSKELLSFLLKKTYENNTKIKCQSWVVDVMKIWEKFEVLTQDGLRYTSDKLVITTWWKSFFQVWTTWDWYKWALDFWHKINTPHRWLCGLVSKKDLSEISWISCDLKLEVLSKTPIAISNLGDKNPPHWENKTPPALLPPHWGDKTPPALLPPHWGGLRSKIYTQKLDQYFLLILSFRTLLFLIVLFLFENI